MEDIESPYVNFLKVLVPELNMEDYGWRIEDEHVRPVWIPGNQDSLNRTKPWRLHKTHGNASDAENESDKS